MHRPSGYWQNMGAPPLRGLAESEYPPIDFFIFKTPQCV